jgi:hypothetical protein
MGEPMKHALIVMLGAVAVFAAGCQNVPPYKEGRAEQFAPPQVIFTGPEADDLRNWTVVDTPIVNRDESDLLFVSLPVRGTGNKILSTHYRVTFLDRNGQPLPGSPSGWLRKDLEPGARELIKFNSTSAKASDFQVELRYAR